MNELEIIIRFIIWLLPLVLVAGLIGFIGLKSYKKLKKVKSN